MHRKTDCTPEKIKEIAGHLEGGCPIEDACILSDVCEKTYYLWRQRGLNEEEPYATFLQESTKARAKGRKFMVEVIFAATSDKSFNDRPAAWFLARSDKKNWGSEIKIDQKNTNIDANAIIKEIEAEDAAGGV